MRSFELLALVFLIGGCAGSKKAETKTTDEGAATMDGLGPVEIQAKSGSSLSGTVSMKEVAEGVEVHVSVENAPPGMHGVHVHEIGDCSAEDAKSAGDHYNPGGHPHGLPDGEPTHLGDFGNMQVGEDGKGELHFTKKGANLDEANELSFRGRALIVHEKQDTGAQPSGEAGARIGCAVLGA